MYGLTNRLQISMQSNRVSARTVESAHELVRVFGFQRSSKPTSQKSIAARTGVLICTDYLPHECLSGRQSLPDLTDLLPAGFDQRLRIA